MKAAQNYITRDLLPLKTVEVKKHQELYNVVHELPHCRFLLKTQGNSLFQNRQKCGKAANAMSISTPLL